MAAVPVTVLLGDPRLPDPSKPGGRFTPDDLDQVRRLKGALAELTDYVFDYRDDHERLLGDLSRDPPGFVLNFCDTGFRNAARHELHVPAFLEMLDIPYGGSGPVALGLCYDKALVRAVAAAHGVPVPEEVFLRPDDRVPPLRLPAFIKPNQGDGSVGITVDSIVHDEAAAVEYIRRLREQLPGTAVLVQELLAGAEYSVGIIGNPGGEFMVLPVLEVDYGGLDPELPRLLDYGSKTDPDSPYWKDIRFREASIPPEVRERISDWCRVLFERLQIRDYGRFDFRAGADGSLRLMEVNPNPAWCWDGKLSHMSQLRGESHSRLLGRFLEAARRRCFGANHLSRTG